MSVFMRSRQYDSITGMSDMLTLHSKWSCFAAIKYASARARHACPSCQFLATKPVQKVPWKCHPSCSATTAAAVLHVLQVASVNLTCANARSVIACRTLSLYCGGVSGKTCVRRCTGALIQINTLIHIHRCTWSNIQVNKPDSLVEGEGSLCISFTCTNLEAHLMHASRKQGHTEAHLSTWHVHVFENKMSMLAVRLHALRKDH
eukprot:1157119-Pelagomonas_calceolata.AAC.5